MRPRSPNRKQCTRCFGGLPLSPRIERGRRLLLTINLLALAVAAAGCVTPSAPPQVPSGAGTVDEAVAAEPQALTAEEGWFAPGKIIVRYREGAESTYASGALARAVQASEAHKAEHETGTPPAIEEPPPIVRLVRVSQPPAQKELEEFAPVAVFRDDDWRRLVREVESAVTRDDGFGGTLLDVAQEKEVFLYRDELGAFRSVPIEYKPSDVPIVRTVTLDDLLDYALPILDGWLQARGSAARQVLLDTGDTVEPAYAFVLIDLNGKRGWFLRSARRLATGKTAEARAQVALHTVVGQVRSLVGRPISSVWRLFTMAGATTLDTLHPSSISAGRAEPVPPLSGAPGMDLEAWERELDFLTGTALTSGTIRYLVDGAQFFPRLIEALNAAERSIDLRLYIFDNDDYALKIADLLKYRSRRTRVRVLLDGLGTFGAADAMPGYTPDYFRGGPSIVEYLRKGSEISVRLVQNPWLQGDHTKTIIIDGGPAFIGGMNIGREYRYEWHDLMVEVTGPVVDVIKEDFDGAWIHAGLFGDFRGLFEKPEVKRRVAGVGESAVRVLQTKPGDSQILRAQIAAIRKAKHRIWIENAYFTSDAILYELAKARRRGIDVRVIMPLRGDSGPVNRSNALAANAMLANGIRVYIYPGMSHVKGAVYDGWACFGSANFDKLSLRLNKELDLATSDSAAVERFVDGVFRPDFKRSVELKEPFPTNWSDHLMALIANQL